MYDLIFFARNDLVGKIFFLPIGHELFMILFMNGIILEQLRIIPGIQRCKNIGDHNYIDFEIFA